MIVRLFLAVTLLFFNAAPGAFVQTGDAVEGEQLYVQQCASCHGGQGQGASAPALVGCSRCDSLDDLTQKIENDMPRGNPGNCIDACAQDTAAYIFEVLNGNTQTTTVPETSTTSSVPPEPSTTTTTAVSSTTTSSVAASTTTTSVNEPPCAFELLYGKDAYETVLLRSFRDTVLAETTAGQSLVYLFNRINPALTAVLLNSESDKVRIKGGVDAVLPLVEVLLEECLID